MKEALEQELVNFAKEIIAHQGQLNISKMRQQALRLTDKITILGFVEKYYQTLKASEERMLYTMRKVASFIEEHEEEDIFNIDTDVTEIEPLNIQFQKEEAAPLAFVAMEPAPITKQSAPAPAAAQPTPPPAFTAPTAPPQPQQHTEPASAPAPTPAAAQPTPPPAFTAPAAPPQPQQHTEPTPAPAPAPAAPPQPQQHTEPTPAPAPAPAVTQPTPPPAFTAPAVPSQPQQHTEPASAPAPAPAAAQPTPPPAFTAPAVAPQPQQHTEPAPYREPLYSIHAKQDPRDETEEEQEARIEKVLQHVFEATQAFIPEAMKYKPFPQEEEEEGVAHEPKDFPTEPEAQPFFAAAAKPATPASTPTAPPPASVAKEPEAEKPHNHNPFEAMAEQFIQQHVQEQAAQQKQQQAAQQVQQMQQQTAQQHLHEQMQHNPFGINNATPNTPFGQPTAAPAAQPQPLENPFAATANQDNVKTSWAMNIDQPSSQNIAQPQPAARQTPSLEEFLSQKAKTASFERKNPEEPKPTQSLNDRFSKAIQIGLNDKLAFVQKLFFGSESEYNKVLKHLEELHTLEEAAVYIQQQVKPTYNHWKGKEEYEERFLSLILRRFE
ncbi:hypothetical protein HMPREF9075_00565 [Capnocytophaga sp. oral taxon 332 str. F0381]|uniref:hypothetical protein n=1 Tax=Capnocytophaga sp. oral taxon 332 TaxID=712213 RepID=UPI0002A19F6F|nr:hypothetical protein [Capnocytophaga sp. oral taxon 332]EKY11673.1 hypothetical protein HMPREF9075_00565 [Capnocytophaga sp. oral taxon 332 str. F0381]